MRKILILLGAVVILAAGCGSDSSNASSGTPVQLSGTTTNKGTKDVSGTSVDVELDDFYFSPTFLKGGSPGSTITLHLKNEGKQPHTFTSPALHADQQVGPGQTADVQVTLPQSGASEFHCTFHQSNGMQGAFFFKDGDAVAAAPSGANTTTTAGGGYYGN